MKTFKVQVPKDKVKFVQELFDNLSIEWVLDSGEGIKEEAPELPKVYEVDEDARKKAAKVREESLKDVISRIEAMRTKKA